jgi:hypothetical protein
VPLNGYYLGPASDYVRQHFDIDVLVKELKRMLKDKASVACDVDTKDPDSKGED